MRKLLLSITVMTAMLAGAWHFLPANEPKNQQPNPGQGQVPEKQPHWTFEVGDVKAARVAGTRLPDGIDIDSVIQHVNERGKQWLDADHKARVAFDKKNPGVLPGRKVEPRTNPGKFSGGDRFDWRDYKKVTAVRDQMQCGSCWDFAALGAYECNYLIRNDKTIDASEQQILDCSGAGSCAGGWPQKVFDYLIKHGTCEESAYPYQAKQGSCKNVTSPYKAISWGFVAPNGAIPSVKDMKTALLQHGPLAVCVNATPAFQHYKTGVFNEHDPGPMNHAVLLVGWDDTKNNGKGAWAIRNSWTPNWGEQGYMWIEYGCNKIGEYACWVESKSVHYEVMTLTALDYRVKKNDVVVVPLYLTHPTDVKNMNWTLHYKANVARLEAPTVTKGNLTTGLFEANPRENEIVKMGLTQASDMITKDGTVALVRFRAVGEPGTRTPLILGVTKVNDAQGKELPIKLVHGSIEIVKDHNELVKGCCFGNTVMGIEDARCALQMSVGNRTVDLIMDMDNDGQVTSRDAAMVLKTVLDRVRTGQ